MKSHTVQFDITFLPLNSFISTEYSITGKALSLNRLKSKRFSVFEFVMLSTEHVRSEKT